jgi:hypothetical protein
MESELILMSTTSNSNISDQTLQSSPPTVNSVLLFFLLNFGFTDSPATPITTASANGTPLSKPTLSTSPAEIHHEIFSYLDPITSSCLGLTRKSFYEMHRLNYPIAVPLQFFTDIEVWEILFQRQLFQLLKRWMGPKYEVHLVNRGEEGREKWIFLTKEAWKRVQRERKREKELMVLYEF